MSKFDAAPIERGKKFKRTVEFDPHPFIICPMVILFLFSLISSSPVFSAPNYLAERDPPMPRAKEQYRLFLRTPDRDCASWRKVKPLLGSGDFLVTESKRDDKTKPAGCKFLWVITPAEAAGDMRFELERTTGPVENFVVPVGGGDASRGSGSSGSGVVHTGGVANANGTGPAAAGSYSGKLKLGGSVNVESVVPPEKK